MSTEGSYESSMVQRHPSCCYGLSRSMDSRCLGGALRKKIPETINAIDGTAPNAEERTCVAAFLVRLIIGVWPEPLPATRATTP
jgi:hypothetical protein